MGGAPESVRRYTLGCSFMILLDQGGRDGTDVTLLPPPPGLARLIEHAWVDRRSHATASDWRVVADASPHLIASVTTSGETRTMRVRLVGARSHGATVDVTGRVLCVGLRLRPGALPAVIDASAREFVDRSLAIEDVFGAGVLADLELAPDAAAPLILHELIRLMRRASGQRTARKILPDSTSPAWTVADLARWTGEAIRSLRERAHREIGLSPKRTLRVLRLHFAPYARRHGRSWAQVAYAAGYADQAHLTRELRALLGETPSAWEARASAVSFKTANRVID